MAYNPKTGLVYIPAQEIGHEFIPVKDYVPSAIGYNLGVAIAATPDPKGYLIAWDPAGGKILWHFRLPSPVSNGPMTYELDGRQYLVVGAGDTLYSFALVKVD